MNPSIKQREIVFNTLHPDANQAQSAMLLLADLEGILDSRLHSPVQLLVRYDLTRISLAVIEDILTDLGFHLDNSLLNKLKRALYHYSEEAQQANLGCPEGDCTRDVFVKRYQRLPHGCRDQRPEHWRNYL